MQITGRLDWDLLLAARVPRAPAAAPAGPVPDPAP